MLSRISSRKVKGRYRNFYVQVPSDWAERMEARGVRHVKIEEVGAKGALVLDPISPERLAEYRAERRRASTRRRRGYLVSRR